MGVIMHDDVQYGGVKGDRGITPSITASATVDATVGTPSVDVVQGGTDEDPTIAFNFHNLKGVQGDSAPSEELIRETVGWVGKNLAPCHIDTIKSLNTTGSWSGNVYTVTTSGNTAVFTFSTTSEGYVSEIDVDGAIATSSANIFLTDNLSLSNSLKLSGCSSGGDNQKYKLLATNTSGGSLNLPEDYGNGADLGVISSAFRIQLRLYSGAGTVSHIKFYPMLRDASITDSTYEPYHKGTVEDYLDSIFDTDADDKPYVFRKGKGTLAKINKLVGGSLAWNQLVQNGNFADTNNWNLSGVSISASNNVATLTVTSAGTSNDIGTPYNKSILNGHKYLLSVDVFYTTAHNVQFNLAKQDWSAYRAIEITGANANVWNNMSGILASNIDLTNLSLLVYLCKGTASTVNEIIKVRNVMMIDLTQMFGSTIANAIYALETATAGAGVAWFRKYFPNEYYAYDAGSLQSVNVKSRKVVGFNVWDEVWEVGSINSSGGNGVATNCIRSKNYNRVIGGTTYYYRTARTESGGYPTFSFYDSNKNFISQNTVSKNSTFIVPANASYFRFDISNEYGTVYLNDVCINISGAEKNGTYEPYKGQECDFDSTKQLRGIPKLVDNALQYDGDIYTPDGQITRKYGIVDLGTLNWGITTAGSANVFRTFPDNLKNYGTSSRGKQGICSIYTTEKTANDKTCFFYDNQFLIRDDSYNEDTAAFKTAMSGVYLVYELATPTTENANSYQNPQRAFTDGTEEFIDAGSRDMTIPVGHETEYDKNVTYLDIEDYTDATIESAVISKANRDEMKDTIGWSCKNKYSIPSSVVSSGLFTVNRNSDGEVTSITANGTGASGHSQFSMLIPADVYGDFYVTGCPQDGGVYVYDVYIWDNTTNARAVKWDGTTAMESDFGSGAEVKLIKGHDYRFVLRVFSGKTVSNLPFYPMLTNKDEVDKTFEPYHDSVEQTLRDNMVLAGKNLLPVNESSSTGSSGVAWTLNNDGTVSASGTATGVDAQFNIPLPKNLNGKYKFTGCPSGGGASSYDVYLWDNTTSSRVKKWDGTSNSESDSDGTFHECLIDNTHDIQLKLRVFSGKTAPTTPFKPMICEIGEESPAFEPYHGDLRQTLRDAEVIEGKNDLPIKIDEVKANNTGGTWSGNTYTQNSATFECTVKNGYVTAIKINGTVSANTSLWLNTGVELESGIADILSGGANTTNDIVLELRKFNGDTDVDSLVSIRNGGEISFTPDYNGYDNIRARIWLRSGTAISNKVIYPMVRHASESDPTFEPYYIPIKDSKFDRAEQRVLGAWNLLDVKATTQTINGITFTVNPDKSVVVNGTATANTNLRLIPFDNINYDILSGRTLKLVGCPKGGTDNTYALEIWYDDGVGHWLRDTGDGRVITFPVNKPSNINPNIMIRNGVTVSNLVFKPMITTDLNATYNDFVPYAMTNRELTSFAQERYAVFADETLAEMQAYIKRNGYVLFNASGEATKKLTNSEQSGQATGYGVYSPTTQAIEYHITVMNNSSIYAGRFNTSSVTSIKKVTMTTVV